jgi:filamentous hemagglutinin family protein
MLSDLIRTKKRKSTAARIICTILAFVFLVSSHAYCLPQIDGIVSGSADINVTGTTMLINAADKTIINFKSFNIGENESVIFNLGSSSSEILNRVIGGGYSAILGSLRSNGIVFLINEAGIRFGSLANVDVAGLVASTRNITDSDFLNSIYNFSRTSKDEDRLLLNEGHIKIKDGGFGVFVAGAIENKGSILCKVGKVAMAAGDAVRVSFPSEGNIAVIIDAKTAANVLDHNGDPVTEQILNTGTIDAEGGMILLKAEAVSDILTKAINLDGFVKARSITGQNGIIELVSNNDINITGLADAGDDHPSLGFANQDNGLRKITIHSIH